MTYTARFIIYYPDRGIYIYIYIYYNYIINVTRIYISSWDIYIRTVYTIEALIAKKSPGKYLYKFGTIPLWDRTIRTCWYY